MTLEESRRWYRQGWIERGADPGKCDEMIALFVQGGKPDRWRLAEAHWGLVRPEMRSIADYDDSDIPD